MAGSGSDPRPPDGRATLEIETDPDVRAGGDGLLQRVLFGPGGGVLVLEAAERAPALADHARAVSAAGGLALLLTAACGWRLDVADMLVLAGVRRWPALDVRRDGMRLAVHEALVNAVMHGCLRVQPHLRDTPEGWLAHSQAIDAALADPGRALAPVLLTLETEPDGWMARVADDSPGFDPPPDSDSTAGSQAIPLSMDRAAHGRGLALMRAVADRVSWTQGGRAVALWFADRTIPNPLGEPAQEPNG